MIGRRETLLGVAALALGGGTARAQAQPIEGGKLIRVISPYAPGGGTDAIARQIATRLATRLGQPTVVDPRPAGTAPSPPSS